MLGCDGTTSAGRLQRDAAVALDRWPAYSKVGAADPSRGRAQLCALQLPATQGSARARQRRAPPPVPRRESSPAKKKENGLAAEGRRPLVRLGAARAAARPRSSRRRARAPQTAARALGTSGGNPVEYVNPHRSDAEALIAAVPVIKVKGNVATCNGGGGALGHPIEYITLNTVDPTIPTDCKYRGLRFVRDPDFLTVFCRGCCCMEQYSAHPRVRFCGCNARSPSAPSARKRFALQESAKNASQVAKRRPPTARQPGQPFGSPWRLTAQHRRDRGLRRRRRSVAGSVYVFRTSDGGATYAEVAKLTASDAAASDNFGRSVAIAGDDRRGRGD